MRILIAAAAVLMASTVSAAPKKASGGAPSHAVSELMGKFKWGMSPEDVTKMVEAEVHTKYAELLKKEQDLYRQDMLRKAEGEEVEKFRASLVKFDGLQGGWDVSIVDHEFVHKNDEAMLLMWETDQRRFLFFWHDQLYKMYIAFNAEHPAFKGKKFDDFATIIQKRYGPAKRVTAKLKTRDEEVLDHLEWPPAGDFSLAAVDQSNVYGNFCLTVAETSVLPQLARSREGKEVKKQGPNALIEAVTTPDKVQGDANADIVDEVVGRKSLRTNQGSKKK